MLPLLGFVVLGAQSCDSCGQDPLVTLIPLGAVQPTADFGGRFLGIAAELPVTIGSQGTAPLSITAVTLEGDGFAMTGDPRGDVAVGQSAEVSVTFTPTELGPAAGMLRIETNAANGPTFVVALAGEGIPDLACPEDEACRMFAFDRGLGACVEQEIDGPCDDGSLCSTEDHCDAGVCVGVAIQCPMLGECSRGVCDPTLGCFNVADPNLCDDDDPCTADSCDVAGGCSSEPMPEGSGCGEFPACTAGTCIAGLCTPSVLADGTPCDDRRICTAGDVCTAGQCAGVRSVIEPAAGVVASAFATGEAFAFPDPVSLPDDVWFFRERTDSGPWQLDPPLLRDFRAVRVTGSTIATQVVTTPSPAVQAPYSVARFADGLVAASLGDDYLTHVSTFTVIGGTGEVVQLGDLALDEQAGMLVADDQRAFLMGWTAIHAVDLSNPAAPVETDTVVSPYFPLAMVATADRLFLGSAGGLDVFDSTGGTLVRIGGDTDGAVLALAVSDAGVLSLRAVGTNAVTADHLDVLDAASGTVLSTFDIADNVVTGLAAHGARAALLGIEIELISLPDGVVLDHLPFGSYRTLGATEMSSTLLVATRTGNLFSLAGDRLAPLVAPDLGPIGLPTRVAPGRVVAASRTSARAIDVSDAAAPSFVGGGIHDLGASLALLEDGRLAPAPGGYGYSHAGGAYGPVTIVDATDVNAPFIASSRSPAAVLNGRLLFVHGSTLIGLSGRQPGYPCDVDCVGTSRVVLETFDLSTQPPFPYPRVGAAVLPDPNLSGWFSENTIAVDAAARRIAVEADGSPSRIIVADASDPTAPRFFPPLALPDDQRVNSLALFGDRLYLAGSLALVVYQIGADDLTPIGRVPAELIPGAAEMAAAGFVSMFPIAVDDEVLVLGLPGAVVFFDVAAMPPLPAGAVEIPFFPRAAASDNDRLVVSDAADVAVLSPACPPP